MKILGAVRFRRALPVVLGLSLLVVPARRSQAQMYGFGYGGYGLAGAYYGGFGYGYPAVVYGTPYPRYGFGYGYGYGNYGYGYPMPGYAYGYPGMGYSGMGYGFGINPYVLSGAPNVNPLFGLGLTPLGVNSALTERALLGRGTGSYYVRSYAPAGRRPAPAPAGPTR